MGDKIFAIGRENAKLHILDLELTTLKVVDHEFGGMISVMETSSKYVAIGQGRYYSASVVTVFDKNGNHVLVSYFRSGKNHFFRIITKVDMSNQSV